MENWEIDYLNLWFLLQMDHVSWAQLLDSAVTTTLHSVRAKVNLNFMMNIINFLTLETEI